VSPKGSTLYVEGKVEGVDPTKHVIAIYIRVTGGWWTKPTFANPITDIASNGAWSCNCQSYFTDADADTVRAYLIPKGYNPPSAAGGTMPPISYAVAMAEATR
jgi:hypothetical protein